MRANRSLDQGLWQGEMQAAVSAKDTTIGMREKAAADLEVYAGSLWWSMAGGSRSRVLVVVLWLLVVRCIGRL